MRYLVFLILFSLPTHADLITFSFEGSLSGYVTESGVQRSISGAYSGVLSFEEENITSNYFGLGNEHQLASYQLGQMSHFSVQTSYDIFESYLNDISATVVDNGLAEGDRVSYHSDNTKFNGVLPLLNDPISMGLIFSDYSKQALDSVALPSVIDLDNFSAHFFLYGGSSATSPAKFSIQGSITSFDLVQVPEPQSLLLFVFMLSLVMRTKLKKSTAWKVLSS